MKNGGLFISCTSPNLLEGGYQNEESILWFSLFRRKIFSTKIVSEKYFAYYQLNQKANRFIIKKQIISKLEKENSL